MKKLQIFFEIILISIVPTLLIFLGKSDLYSKFVEKINLFSSKEDTFLSQNILFFVGLFWSGLITPYQLKSNKQKFEILKRKHSDLLSYNKNILVEILNKSINNKEKLNLRIFSEEKNLFYKLKRKITKEINLKINNISGFCDPILDDKIKFNVIPKNEGLVSKCYLNKTFYIDNDLENTNSSYNLNNYQLTKTEDIKFCAVMPILNNKNDVISVFAIDCEERIDLDENKIKSLRKNIIRIGVLIDKFIEN